MEQKILVFPGSFDPITNGHIDLVKRSIPLFDKIYVAIGINNAKSTLYDLDTRIKWLKEIFDPFPSIEVGHFEGLTVNYCKIVGARYILRGLRNASDFDYEKTISQLNTIIGDNIETLFLISKPEFSHISSTIVREIIKGKGNVGNFVPENIAKALQEHPIA
jgi:pantetheine-phosphate adenylyltransferase